MHHRERTNRWLAAAALALLAAPAAALAQELPEPDAPWRNAENFDEIYLMTALDHAAYATKVLDLCEGRTVHDELTTFCEDTHQLIGANVAQMQAWLNDWFGRAHSPELSSDQLDRIAQIGELDGETFEVEFMHELAEHQNLLIKQAGPCAGGAEHGLLADFCALASQQASDQITSLNDWLCAWYDECGVDDPVASEAATWSALKALYE